MPHRNQCKTFSHAKQKTNLPQND